MEISNLDKSSFFSPSARIVLIPVITFVGLIILYVVLFKIGFDRVNAERARLKNVVDDEKNLIEKESLLKSIQAQIMPVANNSIEALPEKNPAALVVSEIRNSAAINGVVINNLTAGGPIDPEEDIFSATISFDAVAPLFQVLAFLENLEKIAPISQITSASLNQQDELTQATVSLKVHWSPLPENIPKVTESVNPLTAEDQDVIRKINELKEAPFVEVAPNSPGQRSDPFSL